MNVKTATIEFLNSLPQRDWNDTSQLWDSLLVYPSNHLHDSEWNAITIVGCLQNKPTQVLTTCSDDISAIFNFQTYAGIKLADVHIDCSPVSKAFHIWSREVKFHVSASLSSIDITTVRKQT